MNNTNVPEDIIAELDAEQPKKRGECLGRDKTKACPWISCHHHAIRGILTRNNRRRFWQQDDDTIVDYICGLPHSCTLDSVDYREEIDPNPTVGSKMGPMDENFHRSLDHIGEAIGGHSRELVRKIISLNLLKKIRTLEWKKEIKTLKEHW